MASTPNKKRATSSDKGDQSSRSPKAPKQSNPRGSMGLSLLLIAIGTSLIGLGGLGYFFYQELISSSKREVDRSAEAQTRQIENKLASVRQSVDGVASAAKALSQQQPKPKSVDPYQKLIVEGLQKSEPIAGMGIAQNENMLFLTAKPVVSYVWREQSGLKLETSGQKFAATNDNAGNSANNNLLSANRLDILNSPFYKAAIAKGKAAWTEPYNSLGKNIITYSAPISDGQKTMGVVNADAIASNLLPLGSGSVASSADPSSESKIGFVVVSASGKVITASDQFQTSQTQNPAIAEALNSLVQQSKSQLTGIAQAGGNLWAYRKVEGSDWLVVASLPEAVITKKLILLVGGAALGISAILAIAILGFINSLKIRLKPLTEECDRFLAQQGNSGSDNGKNIGKDEIDHLSLALKNTLQQVKVNETRLRSEPQTPSEVASAQVHQSFVETELIEAEVGDLLDVVSSMEEGDLTIEAQVNDRATGLVADTLNRLREKLVEIISSVLGTAQQVAQGASDLEELARTVVLNTAEQAQSVAQGQALTEQVAMIAKRSEAQVNVANQSLQEVRDTVASGQTAINTLTESISVLQTGSAQIVQRMKTLGEFVGLAEQFVQDQGQIASLTQVLALNATLVAARAAEQKDPKQFAGVAREFEAIAGQVNDLATQTNDGLTVLQQRTSQIQTVVTAIDTEVQNLSGLVSGFTTGVESSQSAFNSIQVATEEVVQIGQTITESSTEIAEAADSTANYISEISQLADRTADLTRSARQQAEAMGNQAQQLLQGIRFFRLPDVTAPVATAPQAVETASTEEIAPSTSINSLLDSSTEPNQADPTNSSLGLVVPAIALASATFAISQLGQNTLPTSEPVSDIHDSDIYDLDDDEYLLDELDEDELGETVPNKFIEGTEEIAESDISLDLKSEPDQYPDQYQGQHSDSELTDISAIERSLLADLVQEVYDDSAFGYTDESRSDVIAGDVEDDLSVGTELTSKPTFKDPMDGVDEFAIVEASGDPMIVSATSSFLEDTAFGNASPLSEDTLANLPTSIDFTIPDLDDDDFGIPNITIESTLDDSNSFFDANSVSQSNAQESEMDFDPFYIEQPVSESSDYPIEDDNIFDVTTLDEDIPEIAFGITSENIPTNVFEDYSDYISDEALNESIEESLDNLSNEAYSDTFDISFDESPFDRVLGEALTNSLDNNSLDESLEEGLLEEYQLEESLLLDSPDLIAEIAIAPMSMIAQSTETLEPSNEQPETAFPSMFDESEEELDDESDDFIWQSEAITSNLSDLADIEEEMSQADISGLNLSLNSGLNSEPSLDFELPDFEEMIEADDASLEALLDEAIDFDISDDEIADDFDSLQNSLDTEESSVISVDGLLIDADISSLFNTTDQPEFTSEFGTELGIEDSLDIYEEATLDADEFVGEVESDIGVNDFSEPLTSTFASGSYISEDAFEENTFENAFGEASIFDSYNLDSDLDDDLNSEFLANPLESVPDLSLDFSNDWLEEIVTDADENIQNNIQNMEELSLDGSGDSNYEFPDNLLDSLMDESEEEFAGLPMDFPDDFSDISIDSDFRSISDLVLVNPESDDSESNSESGFDFSAFDQLIDELDELPDNSVTTARAEIDDFLSGSLEEIVEEPPKSEKNKISDPPTTDTHK